MSEASCAHPRVEWRTKSVGPGVVEGWWECRLCKTAFWPKAEVDHLKAEHDKHLEAAGRYELDWFGEKRRADLLEAKCAEYSQVLRECIPHIYEHHTIGYRGPGTCEYCQGAQPFERIESALRDNPGQPLLDYVKVLERVRKAAYAASGAMSTLVGPEKIWHPGCYGDISRRELDEALAACPPSETKERK